MHYCWMLSSRDFCLWSFSAISEVDFKLFHLKPSIAQLSIWWTVHFCVKSFEGVIFIDRWNSASSAKRLYVGVSSVHLFAARVARSGDFSIALSIVGLTFLSINLFNKLPMFFTEKYRFCYLFLFLNKLYC